MAGQPKLRVAICGGGVGGLTLACALSQSPDIQIDIYEAAMRFAEIGAGIGLWWRGKRILTAMGLQEDVASIGAQFQDGRVPSMNYRKSDQSEGQHLATTTSRGGLSTVHRAEFHTILLRRLSPRVCTYTSKRLVTYVQPPNTHDPIQLKFSDGTVTTCDLLIGADGVNSVVRAAMMDERAVAVSRAGRHAEAVALRECATPRFCGSIVYRAIVPGEKLLRMAPQHRVLSAPYQHIIAYPISHGRFVNVALFFANHAQEGSVHPGPWVSKSDPREILRQFDGWETEVRQL
ncbi:hypothetical protein K488DRAFT_23662, partial [Vararia minispora EC-137]